MNYSEWKETFEDKLYTDWLASSTKMSFNNWCKSVWDKRMAEIEIEAYEYANTL